MPVPRTCAAGAQMGVIHRAAAGLLEDPASSILDVDRAVTEALRGPQLPKEHSGQALAGSLLAWIDKDLGSGQSREEWKAQAEGNKILGRTTSRSEGRICAHRASVAIAGTAINSRAT